MATLTEGRHAGEFLVSEANGHRSRETVTIVSGQTLKAGHVLGRIDVDTADLTAAAVAGNTGNGTIALGDPDFAAGVKAGVYRVVCIEPATDGGIFAVEDPDGIQIGVAEVGTEFDDVVVFTISDGATDFAAGDSFTITVAAGSGKFKEYNPGNADGSQTAVAVLFDAVDATDGDKTGVAIVRDAEVNAGEIEWFSGASAGQKTTGETELAGAGIVAR